MKQIFILVFISIIIAVISKISQWVKANQAALKGEDTPPQALDPFPVPRQAKQQQAPLPATRRKATQTSPLTTAQTSPSYTKKISPQKTLSTSARKPASSDSPEKSFTHQPYSDSASVEHTAQASLYHSFQVEAQAASSLQQSQGVEQSAQHSMIQAYSTESSHSSISPAFKSRSYTPRPFPSLFSPSSLKEAILLKEILDTPKGLSS